MRAGRYDLMRRMDADIEDVRKEIEKSERYESKPIRQLMSDRQIEESNLIPMLIESHLAADFLTDCYVNIKDTLHRYGYHAVTVLPELEEIKKLTEKFAQRLIGKSDRLTEMLTLDDTLVAALHKKYLNYIKQRMK